MSLLNRYEGRRVMISWDGRQKMRVEHWLQLTDFLLGMCVSRKVCKISDCDQFHKNIQVLKKKSSLTFFEIPFVLKRYQKVDKNFSKSRHNNENTSTAPAWGDREEYDRRLERFHQMLSEAKGSNNLGKDPPGVFLPLQKWWEDFSGKELYRNGFSRVFLCWKNTS